MLTLVYKDIICQKRNLWLVFAYSAFMHVAFLNLPDLSAYIAGAVVIPYVFVCGQCGLEEKNKADVLMNSLPVRRDTIVKAKYLTGCVFTVLGLLASALAGTAIHYLGFGRSLVDLQAMIAVVSASAFLWVTFYPVYFKFGYLKARYYNMFVFLVVIFATGLLLDRFHSALEQGAVGNGLTNLPTMAGPPDLIPALTMLVVSFLLGLVSLLLSLRFYRGREFS